MFLCIKTCTLPLPLTSTQLSCIWTQPEMRDALQGIKIFQIYTPRFFLVISSPI